VALWDTGRVIILSGQRNALPEPAADIPVGREPIALAAGDLDRDGHLDLVVANWGSGSISVIRGGPSGLGSKAPETIAAGLFPHALRIRDFNGDGLPDVAVVNYGSHDVSCFLGGKDGLAKGQRIPVGDFPAAIAAGDFDSDGFVDIATVDSGSTGISLVRGGPTGMSQSQSVGLLESGAPVGLTPLDFDGDGFLDLVVANQKPGEIVGLRGGAEGLRWGGIIAQGNRPVLLLNSDVDADGFDDVVVVDAGSARAIDLRQAYALPHGHAIVPDPASGEPLVIIDPRSPSRYRLEIEPGGGPEGEPQIAVAPTPLFPIPQEIAAAAGKYFTVLADSLALLREGTELPRPARLSLRLRDHDRSLLDAALRDPRRLKIIRRNGETGCGEIENGPIEIRELSRAKFASFPISRLACYTVVLERERQ